MPTWRQRVAWCLKTWYCGVPFAFFLVCLPFIALWLLWMFEIL